MESLELSLCDLAGSLDQPLDELSLIVDVLSNKKGSWKAAVEVAGKDPADLGTAKTLVILDDHSIHFEVGTDSLAGVRWTESMLNRALNNSGLIVFGEIFHNLPDQDSIALLHVLRYAQICLNKENVVALIEF